MNIKLLSLKKKITSNLRLSMISYVIFSLIIGLFCFILLFISSSFVTSRYLEPIENKDILNSAVKEFQDYIDSNNINSTNWELISTWNYSKNHVYVLHSVSEPKKTDNKNNNIEKVNGIQLDSPINYNDAQVSTNFILITNNNISIMVLTLTIIISFIIFTTIFYKLLKKKVDYILEIEDGVSIFEGGDLHHTIELRGNDELNRLAISINNMSATFLQQIILQEQATQSNKEIIGELSHDIRTPLTILSGYLPLLLQEPNLNTQQKEYLLLIEKKTTQIKERINELLDYATIYSGQQKISKVRLDVTILLQQLIAELNPLVLVIADEIPQNIFILGDLKLISKLFDNLISNIKLHSNLNKPVYLNTTIVDNFLYIEINNSINQDDYTLNSSLGIKISQYILTCHNGELVTRLENNTFITTFYLPLLEIN